MPSDFTARRAQSSADTVLFAFNGYEVDPDRIELRHEGANIHVEPQVFDVICYLIEHRERVISKIELFDEVWGGAFVGESALTSRIKTARKLLGDDGQAQRVIRTVHRRGYQFVADVVERASESERATTAVAGHADLPTGTVSFLFTDIEGSSRLWEQHPEEMDEAIRSHNAAVRDGIAANSGFVFATAGDGFAAAFERATDAVAAARSIRAELDDMPWPEPLTIRVRLGVHSGEAIERDGDYLGPAVNRAARVMSAAHGGQTLVSDVTRGLLSDAEGLVDLGMCQIDAAMHTLRIWQLDGPVFPPLTGTTASRLPSLRKELIGRSHNVERVSDAISEHQLVTVVGPGGAGKTTLALAVANSMVVTFPGGVIFVELAAVQDGGGIIRAVAQAAGIDGPATDIGSMAERLGRRSVLLVLDNCEHLLDECAGFVDELLDSAPDLALLTTSREPLGVEGEVVEPLGSLHGFASELFVARARDARADIELEADDQRVVTLCEQLDGLPLAIELAAAQLGHLSLDDLTTRLGALLELSARGRNRSGDRHATLERTIAWSHDLLDQRGQWLFRQFGVFPGTFDLAAAEAVGRQDDGGSILDTLADLIAKNLLTWDPVHGRYRLLATIRAFAIDRLTEVAEVDEAEERLRRHVADQTCTRSRLERWLSGDHAASVRNDLDNHRFAFDRSMWAEHTVDALEIHIGCSYLFRNTNIGNDGRRWATRVDETLEVLSPRDRLWALLVRADVAQGTADHELGLDTAREAVELAADVDDHGAALIARHFEALHQVIAAPARARSEFVELVAQSRTVDPRLVQLFESFRSVTELAAGELAVGTELAERVGHQVEGGGYEVFIANWAAWTAALINRDAGRLRYWRERQRAHLKRIGGPEPWLFLWSSALVSAMEGEDPTAGLRRARERADQEGHDVTLDVVLALAICEQMAGRSSEAAELLGLISTGHLNNLSHYLIVRTLRAELDDELGAAECLRAMKRGSQRLPADVLSAMAPTTSS